MIIQLTLIGLLMVTSVTPAPKRKLNDDIFQLIILHNNDMHARFEQTGALSNKCIKEDADNNKCYGGFARVAHEVREYRKRADDGEIPSVLYLNAGDTYTGTPWFALFKDKIASDFLKILKPDAISLGNHEFDEGSENLAKFLSEVDFPVLVANLNLDEEPELKTPNLMPSLVIEKEGRRIGLIGYLTPETKEVAIPNKVEFYEEIDAINAEAEKLKAQGINIIIALGHSGLEKDKQIAAHCPDIDIVIGGHSHTFLYTGEAPDVETPFDTYPVFVTQDSGKRVLVVQAYAYTKYLGYLHLEFDDEGNLVEFDGAPILLDGSIERDKDVLDLLEVYRPAILELENEIVGTTKVLLDGSCRRNECNLGNLIADSFVYWNAIRYPSDDYWTDAPIGFIQGGGVRASIDHRANGGKITKEDAQTVMPFESKIEVVELTGEDLLKALEHSVARYQDGEGRGEFLQFSGLQVVYDINRPVGQRVVEAKVLCAQCQLLELQNIDSAKTYRVVMQDFLANGGDGYEMFKGKSIRKTEALDLDVMVEYFKKKSPIYAAVEWRITIKDLVDPSKDILGTSRVLLDNNCRQNECNLGNFVTDAMVDWYSSKYQGEEFWTDASIAVIQGGRLKASIKANSDITRDEASKVFQPANFNLNVITLTGNELKLMLEHSVSRHDVANNVEFLQLSGLQVDYDMNKAVGQRVIDVKVLCAKCVVPELQPLVSTAEYKVIMQSVLASGADGYAEVFGLKELDDLEESDVNVFMEYIKKKSPIRQAVEWRITIKPYVDPLLEEVGSTRVLLDNNCQNRECNLGNFIADSMVDWYSSKYESDDDWTDASIAIIQGSRIKASISQRTNDGVILRGDVNKVFEPEFYNLNLVTFTGSELKALLEHSVSKYSDEDKNVEFLQISGLQVDYDMNHPVGQRVTDVKVLCAKCVVPELEALVNEAEYKVIMQSVLADGADGYDSVIGTRQSQNLEESDVNVLIAYLKKKSPVCQAIEWRITIKPYFNPLLEQVGSTKVLLDHNCQQNECNLGNFIADSMVDWYSSKFESDDYWTDASIAIIQGSRIKTSISSRTNNGGIILRGDVNKVFEPQFYPLKIVTLTGAELKTVLEHSISKFGMGDNAEFLQVSGLQIEYDVKRPVGQRVIEVKVLCALCNVPQLSPLNYDADYKVIMQSVLSEGSDGYGELFGNKQAQDLMETDVNVVISYLKKKSPVFQAVEWRITFRDDPESPSEPPTSTAADSTTTGSSTTGSTTTDSSSTSQDSTATNPASDTTSTTQGGSTLNISLILILMTTILSFMIKS